MRRLAIGLSIIPVLLLAACSSPQTSSGLASPGASSSGAPTSGWESWCKAHLAQAKFTATCSPWVKQVRQKAGPAESPKPKGPRGPIAVVRDGAFQFTVHRLKCGVSRVGSGYAGAKAKGQFCLLYLTVKNVKAESGMFSGSDQFLFDATGRKFSDDTEAEIYLPRSNSILQDLNPGLQVNAIVVFDIPKGVRPVSLELHDSPFSGGATVPL